LFKLFYGLDDTGLDKNKKNIKWQTSYLSL